jgi:hypothetical protein
MRRFLLFLAVFLVVASAASGVHASTDCERWFIAYKNALAQSNAAKHLAAAKHRARRYVHRKLAALKTPANKPKVLRVQRPKMTREEALRRFNLACGDLPPENMLTTEMLEEKPKPDYLALHGDIPLENAPTKGLIAANVLPPYSPGGGSPFVPGLGGGFGGGGTAPGGSGPNPPPTDGPPPVSAIPEPGSIVLMLTGIVGAGGVGRCRYARCDR